MSRSLQIIDTEGEHIEWADEFRAHQLLKSKQAEAIYNRRGRIRALRAVSYAQLIEPGSSPRATRYSHDHETRDNPNGCWTLVRLPRHTAALYRTVVSDCLAGAA